MTEIKYLGTEPRVLPWEGGRLVLPGQVVDVEEPDAYTCQDIWEPVKDKSKAAAARGEG